MKISIIGAGNIGGTVARELVKAGHSVKLAASKGADAVRVKAEAIGATPVSAQDAVKDADVIVLSIPFAAIPDIAPIFADVPGDVVVIDTSNYYPLRDGRIAEVDAGKPESVWSSEQLGRPIIKAFNAVLADTLENHGKPSGAPGRIALPVAGDDPRGKRIAADIVDIAGFDTVDSGSLADSWRHQPGTPAYCSGLSASELEAALAVADRDQAPNNRDILIQQFMSSGSPPTHETGTIRNREVTARR